MTNSPDQPYGRPQPADGFTPIDYPEDVQPSIPGYPPMPPPYPPVASPFSVAGPPGYPPAPPPYPQPSFTPAPPPPYPGYAGGYDPYLAGRPMGTNGMAIGSLVCSLAGLLFCGVPSVVGLILGIVALGQCKRTGQEGHGMALAGVIIGAVVTLIYLLLFFLGMIGAIYGDGHSSY